MQKLLFGLTLMWLLGLCQLSASVLAGSRRIPQNGETRQDSVVRMVFRARREDYRGTWTKDVLESIRSILEKRAHNRGITQATFTAQWPDRIVAELPRAATSKAFLQYLQSPARLEFYPLPQLGNRDGSSQPIWQLSVDPKTHQNILVHTYTGKPLTQKEMQTQIFNRPPPLTGKELLPRCQAMIVSGSDKPVIEFEFNRKGARAFEALTRTLLGKHLGIFLDKQLLTAPIVNAVISSKGVLEGNFTRESAKDLADQLNTGFLPVPVEIISR
jgi:preprotein translocase subunit SecD